jgi:hypothetical protein
LANDRPRVLNATGVDAAKIQKYRAAFLDVSRELHDA